MRRIDEEFMARIRGYTRSEMLEPEGNPVPTVALALGSGVAVMAAGFVAGFWLEGLIAGCAVAWWMLEYGNEVIDIFFAFMRCPLCEGRVERRNGPGWACSWPYS